MTESPRDTLKQFGRIEPHPDKGDGHIGVDAQDRGHSVGAWTEFEEIVGVSAEIRPNLIDIRALERKFEEIETALPAVQPKEMWAASD